ncbi:hypothetical protein ACN28S_25400 [Cystobacter fuscus]
MSDIAMKLLEKRPEDRYPSTEALLQALDAAAEKGSTSPAWKVPLFLAEEGRRSRRKKWHLRRGCWRQSPRGLKKSDRHRQSARDGAHSRKARARLRRCPRLQPRSR